MHSSPMSRSAVCFALVFWLVFAGCSATAQEQALPLEPLVIETAQGSQHFSVEVARTSEQRAIGLMNRKELAPDRGMLFDFGVDRPVVLWMKNTYVPLDILFIERSGRVSAIAEDTEPLSEAHIESGIPVRSALELLSGTVRRLAIAPGDWVRHPLFGTDP